MAWEEVGEDIQLDGPAQQPGLYTDPQTGRQVLRINITGRQPEEAARGTLDVPEGWEEFTGDLDPEAADLTTRSALERGGRDMLNTVGAAADLVTLPITTVMQLLGANIRPYREITDEFADDLGLARSVTPGQRIMSAINEGGVLGLATAGAGSALAPVAGVTGAVGRSLAATPVADMAAGATGGGAYQAAGEVGFGPMGQLGAALLGGAAGAGAVRAGPAVRNAMPGNRQPNELAAAAEELGVDLLPADAGGPTVRRLTAAAAQAPISAAPIIEAGQRVVEQAKRARDRIASSFGAILAPDQAGEAASRGAREYIKRSGQIGGRLYDQAARLSDGVRVPLNNARATLDGQMSRLRENPVGDAALRELQELRSKLERPEGFTVQGVRDMRTDMFIKPDLRGTPVEKRIKEVVDAAAHDIEDGLRAAGKPEAAAAFKAADDYWRERIKNIDNVLRPIIGPGDNPKGGEAVYKAIESAAKGDAQRLYRFMHALPEEDADLVRASLIGRLGRANRGAQNAEGDAFSLQSFLTHWNELSPRAKNILFTRGSREALDNLAKVADATKEAASYANRSNTAGAIVGQTAISGGAAGLFGLEVLAATLAAQYGAGKLLASPRFARWLASAAKKPNGPALREQVKRLSAVAAAEPTIANEVHVLQARLNEALMGVPSRVAAEEEE